MLLGLHHKGAEEIQSSGETCLTLCFAKYQEGLKKVPPAVKGDLYSMYLDCLIDSQREHNELPNSVKKNLLLSALEEASNEKHLTEQYYIKWLELVTDEDALRILEKGTVALPDSIDLWRLRLRYAVMTDSKREVNKVFEDGLKKLNKRSLPLWHMYLRYYGLLGLEKNIENIYQRAVIQPPEISQAMKPKYIEWLAVTKGINEARKKYNELARQTPYCKELHSTMSKLESTKIEHEYDVWARVHELACDQFGKEDVDVWINHILFYLHFNRTDNVNEKVQTIYAKAIEKLSSLLHSDFKEKYERALSSIQ